MMRTMVAAVIAACLLTGCVKAPSAATGPDAARPAADGSTFDVPGLRVGDRFVYGFSFQQGRQTFAGTTVLTVLDHARAADGYGNARDALHLRQAQPGSTFAEDYWIDAETFAQFKLAGLASYSQSSHAPPPPMDPVPYRDAAYANGTGTRERFVDDPFFEDANFFGVFASGRPVPGDGSFEIAGKLWQRNGTRLLTADPVQAKVDVPADDPHWGALRQLTATAAYDGGEHDREAMTWSGAFAATVPLALSADRHIVADFFGDTFDVRFNATLESYTAGPGEPLARGSPLALPATAGDRADWISSPAEGSHARLGFPLSEALTALGRDPTALQYFQQHAGSYLYYGNLYDVETCGFYGATRPPGCHWTSWEGFYFAPDDYILSFTVEKFASDDGTGASYAPAVTRGQIVDDAFGAPSGRAPPPPELAIESAKYDGDLPSRDAFPHDGLTISGAVDLWARHADAGNQGQTPNRLWFHLGPHGYTFNVAYDQWWFPAKNPELFFLHDHMPFELERHSTSVDADGRVLESHNYQVVIEEH